MTPLILCPNCQAQVTHKMEHISVGYHGTEYDCPEPRKEGETPCAMKSTDTQAKPDSTPSTAAVPLASASNAAPKSDPLDAADIKSAVEKTIQQYLIDSLTPDRGYALPVEYVTALVSALRAERDRLQAELDAQVSASPLCHTGRPGQILMLTFDGKKYMPKEKYDDLTSERDRLKEELQQLQKLNL